MEKVFFVIPGYRQTPTQKAYTAIEQILTTEGYIPVLVSIPWKQTTISANTQLFLDTYRHYLSFYKDSGKRKKTYILGFSFGAMIAFLASTKVAVSGLILCSLSPYFQEDMTFPSLSSLSSLTLYRYLDFFQLPAATLAQQVKAQQVLMLYGEREDTSLIRRVRTTYRFLSAQEKGLIAIKNTEHTIGSTFYLQHIHHAAKILH